MNPILLRTTFATLVAFAGGVAGVALGPLAARRLNLLVTAAMGALLAVTLLDVLPDAKALLSWPVFGAATLSGLAVFWLLGHYVAHICPACSPPDSDAPPSPLGTRIVLLMAVLAVHSTLDGVAVSVGDVVVGHANWPLLLAVSLHKLPEGLALALLLLGGGYAPRRALAGTCLLEATTELGGLVGVYGLRAVPAAGLGLVLAHVGGGFFYLIGTTLNTLAPRTSRLAARPLVLGGGLAFTLTAALLWTMHVLEH